MAGVGNVESKPVFKARAAQIGISDLLVTALDNANICSFGAFAFSCAFQPGGSDETQFVNLVKKVIGRDPSIGELALLRRLFFEAHAVCLQDMRNRVDKSSDAAPTKILAAERAARYEDQVRRLVGFEISGPLEPSHTLIDAVFSMAEANELRYLAIYKLTSREQEMSGENEDEELKEYTIRIRKGDLALREKDLTVRADLTSDLRVRFALQRRALAFDQACLISWEVHDKWISSLFYRMAELPLKGYLPVSLEQCLRADKKLFVKMSEACRSGIVGQPGQPRPLDEAMKKYGDHNDVLYLLAPTMLPTIPETSSSSWTNRSSPYESKGSSKEGKGKGGGKGQGKGAWPYRGGKGHGQGKGKGGKGKGKGKGGSTFGPPPGCATRTPNGENICFGFNCPGGCGNHSVEPGQWCSRGLHVCGRCFQRHGIYDCPQPGAAVAN